MNRPFTTQQSTIAAASPAAKNAQIHTTPGQVVANNGRTNEATSTDPHPRHQGYKKQ